MRAINFWQANTCLQFVQSTTAANKLKFTSASSGCWSYVGRIASWSSQDVNIGSGCNWVRQLSKS
jgi:hypothetical protein